MGDGREVQEGGTHVHLWLIHVGVWQKPIQYCKANIYNKKFKKKYNPNSVPWHSEPCKACLSPQTQPHLCSPRVLSVSETSLAGFSIFRESTLLVSNSRPSLWLILLLGTVFTWISTKLALYDDIQLSAQISPPQGALPQPPSLDGVTLSHFSPQSALLFFIKFTLIWGNE